MSVPPAVDPGCARHFATPVTCPSVPSGVVPETVAASEGEQAETVYAGFAPWYPTAHAEVLSTVALWCGSLDAAREATDEAFVRALDRWARVSTMASPVGWTVSVAINVARRKGRRRAMEAALLRRIPDPAALPPPAGEVFDAVAQLPPRQRTIVLLRYITDLQQADIAGLLGISRSVVSTALTDAHRRLASILVEDEPAPTGGRHD